MVAPRSLAVVAMLLGLVTGSEASSVPQVVAPTSACAGSVISVGAIGSGLRLIVTDSLGTVLYDSDASGTSGQDSISTSLTMPWSASFVYVTAIDSSGWTTTSTITVT